MARRIRWQLLIAGVSALLIMALMGSLAISQTAVARPSSGGAYVEGVVGRPEQLNPLLNDSARDPVGADIGALLFDGLTRYGASGLPEPGLAESWEISPDSLVYTFTLRSNLSWHDGRPLTSDDVVFTLRAIKRPEFAGPPALQSLWRDVIVDKIDDRRVRCTLTGPYSPFLGAAAVPIVPAHLLEAVPLAEWSGAGFSRSPVGSGPYRLVSLDGERAVLTANQEYFGQTPFVDRVELRFFSSNDDALQALDQGQLDGFGYVATRQPGVVTPPPGSNAYNLLLDDYTVLTFNLRRPPLDRLELRRALARGLDRSRLIAEALDDRAVMVDTPILPGWWAYTPEAIWYPPDPQLAGDSLTEQGYALGPDGLRARNGQPLQLEIITDGALDRVAAVQEITRQWQQLGIGISVTQLDGAALQERLRRHDFDLALHGWTQLGADPDILELWHSSQAADGFNYAGLQDDAVDGQLNAGRSEIDLVLRAQSYAAFQQRWIELAPSIMLYQPVYTYIVQQRVGIPEFQQAGAPLLFSRADRFRTISRWFVESSSEIRGDLRGPR